MMGRNASFYLILLITLHLTFPLSDSLSVRVLGALAESLEYEKDKGSSQDMQNDPHILKCKHQEHEAGCNGDTSQDNTGCQDLSVERLNVDTAQSWLIDALAFGSCSKQNADDLSIWQTISKKNPSAWVWMGDSIYSDCGSSNCVELGYKQMLNKTAFRNFLSSGESTCKANDSPSSCTGVSGNGLRFVDGTWDDHDYGCNDAGKNFPNKIESQTHFLNFLDEQKSILRKGSRPHKSTSTTCRTQGDEDIISQRRRERKGVYSSHIFGASSRNGYGMVKLLLLDTRYHRDNHYIPSLGTWIDSGVTAVGAAFIRWACSFTGAGSRYDGDILGEEQWMWLETQLTYSDGDASPAVHIIVSSIQVLTDFPVVESWGHFPLARERLFALLRRTKPRGLIFLSGDVHFGEFLGRTNLDPPVGMQHGDVETLPEKTATQTQDSEGLGTDESCSSQDCESPVTIAGHDVMEITSSGLTHSLGDSILSRYFIKAWKLGSAFTQLRTVRVGPSLGAYSGKNFGLLEFTYDRGSTGRPEKTANGEDALTSDASGERTVDTGANNSTVDDNVSPIIEIRASIYDVNGRPRLSSRLLFDYNSSADERYSSLASILDSIPLVVPIRSRMSMVGRGCGFGLLAFWAMQVAVLFFALAVRRLMTGRKRATSAMSTNTSSDPTRKTCGIVQSSGMGGASSQRLNGKSDSFDLTTSTPSTVAALSVDGAVDMNGTSSDPDTKHVSSHAAKGGVRNRKAKAKPGI